MASKKISAAEAMKSFRSAGIKVQTATPGKAKGTDGVERYVMEVASARLSEEHILDAVVREDGVAVIVTIDGVRHEARAASGASKE